MRGRPGRILAPIPADAVVFFRRLLQKPMAAQDAHKASPVKVQVLVEVMQ